MLSKQSLMLVIQKRLLNNGQPSCRQEVVSEGDTYTINIGDKQLVFKAGVENRLFKLIFHGAKQPEKLQLGQIRFDLLDKK